ncbi:unnamed protein product [Cylicocyclus nassatus]|uniref:Uncharacterized protein n=1 Tax=Cylicocyclus nassatus TaxID=53992 RepID=A0AA36HC45_CYLNA|nr:unnamed protein product [Cylicocyclus nassatus]
MSEKQFHEWEHTRLEIAGRINWTFSNSRNAGEAVVILSVWRGIDCSACCSREHGGGRSHGQNEKLEEELKCSRPTSAGTLPTGAGEPEKIQEIVIESSDKEPEEEPCTSKALAPPPSAPPPVVRQPLSEVNPVVEPLKKKRKRHSGAAL